MQTKEIALGAISKFPTFPAEINLGYDSYFLSRLDVSGFSQQDSGESESQNESESENKLENQNFTYLLISVVCPHAGGTVFYKEQELVCPLHYWRFEIASGKGINVPNACLDTFPVIIRGDQLFVELPV